MSDLNPIRFLGVNDDQYSLALKTSMGMLAGRFDDPNSIWNASFIRRMGFVPGKSHQIGLLSNAARPFEYVDGQDVNSQPFAVDEALITLDNKRRLFTSIGETDLKLSPFTELLPRYIDKMAMSMITTYSQMAMTLLCQCYRATAVSKGGILIHNGGVKVTRVGPTIRDAYPLNATGSANLRADIATINEQLDFANAPSNRVIIMRNELKGTLTTDPYKSAFSIEYGAPSANNANEREIRRLDGMAVFNFQNSMTQSDGPMPNINTADLFSEAKFRGDFRGGVSNSYGFPAFVVVAVDEMRPPAIFSSVVEMNPVTKWDDHRRCYTIDSVMQFKSGIAYPYIVAGCEIITG